MPPVLPASPATTRSSRPASSPRCWCWAAERFRLPKPWIGYTFLGTTVLVYAVIGLMCRTTDPVEYFVAGRRKAGGVQRHGGRRRLDERGPSSAWQARLYVSGFDGLAYA